MIATRQLRRTFAGVVVAAVAAVVVVAPTVAAGELVIAPAVKGESRILGGVAAAGDNVVVAWQAGFRSFIRWSTDGGSTFQPKYVLRKGLRAKAPRVAACGDTLWAASTWTTSAGPRIGVDYVDISGPTPVTGRFIVDAGRNAVVACIGDVLALTWSDTKGDVQLAVVDGTCGKPCVPSYRADLGAGTWPWQPQIAAYDHGFVVVFPEDGFLVNTFDVAVTGDSIDVTANPSTRILAQRDVYSPYVGADGSRVVIAYGRGSGVEMKISDDRAKTFGTRIILPTFCRNCYDAGSSPRSVDVLGKNIVVEVGSGYGLCDGICGFEEAFFTRTDGQKWKKLSYHQEGRISGALLPGRIAEAWDYDDGPEQIRFQIIPLP
jgi:hypothetical protein